MHTTTTWTFPDSDSDMPTTYPGFDHVMGLGAGAYQTKYEQKQAKLAAKEAHRQMKERQHAQKRAQEEQYEQRKHALEMEEDQ